MENTTALENCTSVNGKRSRSLMTEEKVRTMLEWQFTVNKMHGCDISHTQKETDKKIMSILIKAEKFNAFLILTGLQKANLFLSSFAPV